MHLIAGRFTGDVSCTPLPVLGGVKCCSMIQKVFRGVFEATPRLFRGSLCVWGLALIRSEPLREAVPDFLSPWELALLRQEGPGDANLPLPEH